LAGEQVVFGISGPKVVALTGLQSAQVDGVARAELGVGVDALLFIQ
jgi:hypothetical protein